MRNYTQQVFLIFWDLPALSAIELVSWTKAQGMREEAFPAPHPSQKGQLIDSFFIFCWQGATGLREQVIANCGVRTSTESWPHLNFNDTSLRNYLQLQNTITFKEVIGVPPCGTKWGVHLQNLHWSDFLQRIYIAVWCSKSAGGWRLSSGRQGLYH